MARSIIDHLAVDADGDVQPNKSVSVTLPGGGTFDGTLYDAVSGGSVVTSPTTNTDGYFRAWTDIGSTKRVKVAINGGTAIDSDFRYDPADVMYDGRSVALSMSGLLTLSGGLALSRASASNPALTVQNTNAAGQAVVVKNNSGTTILEHTRTLDPLGGVVTMDVISLRNGAKFNMESNGGFLFNNRMFSVIHGDVTTDRVMALFDYTNSSPIGVGTPDVEPMGIIAHQAVATDSYLRAVEIDTVSNTTTSNWPKIGAEISAQFAAVGNTKDYAVGISIRNLGDAWGIPVPKRGDSALAIGSDQYGWENAILYRDVDSLHSGDGPLLFKVTKTGAVNHAATISPVADATAALGTSSLRYTFLFAYNTLLEDGLASAPSYAFRSGSTTGFYRDTTPGIGFAVAGARAALLKAADFLVEGSFTGKQISTPAAPATGYTSLYPKSGGGIYSRAAGGAEKQHKAGGQNDFSNALSGSAIFASGGNVYATITNGSRALTTIGGDLLVSVNLCAANTLAGNATFLALSLDGAAEVGEVVYTATVNNGQFVMTMVAYRFTGVSAASHTVAARWKVSAGTSTIYSGQMTMQELPS